MQSVQSTNPALRNSPFAPPQGGYPPPPPQGSSYQSTQTYPGTGTPYQGGPPAGYQPGPQMYPPQPGYPPVAPPTIRRRMTLDDVVVRTAIALLVLVAAASAAWVINSPVFYWAFLPALVLGLVIAFKQITNPVAVLAYAGLQGLFLGTISNWFDSIYPGIAIQAVMGTFAVFAAMLVLYRSTNFRMTAKMQKVLLLSLCGVIGVSLFNVIYFLFTGSNTLLRDGGPVAIIFSLVVIAIAAFCLLADFDMIERGIENGVDERFAWYAVFGLLVTLIWLYLEILRLLSYLRE